MEVGRKPWNALILFKALISSAKHWFNLASRRLGECCKSLNNRKIYIGLEFDTFA